jgi:hypothetical protein
MPEIRLLQSGFSIDVIPYSFKPQQPLMTGTDITKSGDTVVRFVRNGIGIVQTPGRRTSIALLATVLFMCACATPAPPKATWLDWQRASRAEVHMMCKQMVATGEQMNIGDRFINGCSKQMRDGRCLVITPVPDEVSSPEFHRILGHEVAHCFYGSFHPN